ncbi:MAG: hypothetical protein J6X70_00845 [Muribaculaceae bacterium]|nr:hypothetical protein [Muribaculaceae bacterium]
MAELNRQEIERQQQLWVDNWAKMMVQIWKDRLSFYNIRCTGALMESFTEDVTHDGLAASIIFRFLAYGVYQASGVGYGYTHGNGGDLPFLGADYRHEHRLDVPRKVGPAWGGGYTSGFPREKRDWLNRKLYASIMKLKEAMAHMVGEQAAAVLCDALMDNRRFIVRNL